MQADSFAQLYASKTDGELLELAADKNSLLDSARLALTEELNRRDLSEPDEPENDNRQQAPTAEVQYISDKRSGVAVPPTVVWVGLFLLDTAIVFILAEHVSHILSVKWVAWIAPLLGLSRETAPANWYLQHFELVTILPALLAGYFDVARFVPATLGNQVAARRVNSPSLFAWSVPAASLLIGLLTFHPSSSVLFDSSPSALSYYFDIQRAMPAWANLPGVRRYLTQLTVTAPFYAGVAYSLGALAWKYALLDTIFGMHRPGVVEAKEVR